MSHMAKAQGADSVAGNARFDMVRLAGARIEQRLSCFVQAYIWSITHNREPSDWQTLVSGKQRTCTHRRMRQHILHTAPTPALPGKHVAVLCQPSPAVCACRCQCAPYGASTLASAGRSWLAVLAREEEPRLEPARLPLLLSNTAAAPMPEPVHMATTP